MSKNIVFVGQNFLNKVVELTGSIDNAFEVAIINNLSLTDNLIIGTELKSTPITNKAIFNFFDHDNKPTTSLTVNEIAQFLLDPGIDEMIIETNFMIR